MTSKPSLNRASAPDYAIDALPECIVQFGGGNFLRAFADWMVDVANRQGKICGRVVVVKPTERHMTADLNSQDCRYHVIARGVDNGTVKESMSLVSSISRELNPHTDWKGYLSLAAQPGINVVVSNTTEAGISYTAEDLNPGKCPASFPAKVCVFLKERFERLGGPKAPGLIFLPCELIAANGNTLKDCVLSHAAAWKLDPAFASWIADANHFCNTLVDRIVPGFPKTEMAELKEKAGFDDRLMVATEWFYLWVIEGSPHLAARFPSLGCIQKGGDAIVVDVLKYGERVRKNGLTLLAGPGNDMVACTALAAAGANIILFTTGRGTPLGGPVPTLKVASHSDLAKRKPAWIDFDAGILITGAPREEVDETFFELVLATASGQLARNETHGYREISIFKDGVTL